MKMSTPIRVMLVDDHEALRESLAIFLDLCDDLEFVGEAENGAEAVQLSDELKPDVILMDLVMPVMNGATATRKIVQKHPDIQIIALTSFGSENLMQAAIEAGAADYMLKNVSIDELADSIRAVVALRDA